IGLLVLTARGRVEANYGSTVKLIFSLDHGELSAFYRLAQDLAIGEHICRALADILFYCRFDQVIGLGVGFGLSDGRIDLVDDRFQVGAGHLFAGTGGGHGATFLMSEHDQHRAMKVVDGILDTPQAYGVGDVTRGAYDEEIAEALVKNQLGRNPAVGTREDNGVGLLSRSEFAAKRRQRTGLRFTSNEALVARHYIRPNRVRRRRRRGGWNMSSMRRGGDGLLRHARNHECKQNRKVCTCRLHKDVGFINRMWRRGSESNRRIKVLQTSPLPLRYRAAVPKLAPS